MNSNLRHRKDPVEKSEKDVLVTLETKGDISKYDKKGHKKLYSFVINLIIPLFLSGLSFYLRYYGIGDNDHVIWDEAHFAKFGSYYNKHTFYHDVHPPLGKMLCGLSEYLVGYKPENNWDYMFESGSQYPEDINYFGMRLFQVIFSSSLVPVTWFICLSIKLPVSISWLISLVVCLESSFIVLGKFVLLDSFLFFFTATTMLGLAKYNEFKRLEGKSWRFNFWMLFLGLNIGCVCSVKWVGLFVTSVVGIYTVIDLWLKFWDQKLNWVSYARIWINRVFNLILVPFLLYLVFFKIHFSLLYLPGDGSGSMNTLFQIGLKNTDIVAQPRFVQLGDEITLRSQGFDSNLLHSHIQTYPEGSQQHQVTTYGFKDYNNNWKISNSRSGEPLHGNIKEGDVIRLQHIGTGANLHSHPILGHVTTNGYEVSGYGNDAVGDEKDDWIVEIVDQIHSANLTYSKQNEQGKTFAEYLHPVSTVFRLKHRSMGCYLSTSGKSYPSWGFSQGEVVCMDAPAPGSIGSFFNSNANWNIESVVKTQYEPDTDYEYPKSNFFKDFVQIQNSMAKSNSALVPDPNKNDAIASSWWEWPIMRTGIKMSNWSPQYRRYFMMGNPILIWLTTVSVPVSLIILVIIIIKWRHQNLFMSGQATENLLMHAFIPLFGYVLHYLPFIVMGRVTYYHHYMPALYFAVFISGFVVDYLTKGYKFLRFVILFLLNVTIIGSFILFYPTCLGMTGSISNYSYINWLPTWEFSVYKPFNESASLLVPYLQKKIGSFH